MARKPASRRSRGDGSVGEYKTKAGLRFYWKATLALPDGGSKVTWKRGFTTKRAAQDALREALSGRSRRAPTPSRASAPWAAGRMSGWPPCGCHRPRSPATARTCGCTSSRTSVTCRWPASRRPGSPGCTASLKTGGRCDGKGELTGKGLSARTVRYVHTIVSAALSAAVNAEPPLLIRNPAANASPPPAQEAEAPEMHPCRPTSFRVPGLVEREQWPARGLADAGPYRHAAR